MNAVETPTPSEVEEAPLSLEDLILQVEDGSRLAEGEDAKAIADEISDGVKAVKSSAVRLTNHLKAAAERIAFGRAKVFHPDGRPDWAGETGTWKAIARVAIDTVLVDMAKVDRDRLTSSIRQHVNRTFLELAIRQYVAVSLTTGGDPFYPEAHAWVMEHGTLVGYEGDEIGTEQFVRAVRRQYVDAELAIPNRYKSAEDKQNDSGGGGGPGNGPKNAITAAFAGVAGLKQTLPLIAAKVALKATSELVQRVTTGEGAVEDRHAVADVLVRMNELTEYGVKFLTDPDKVKQGDRPDADIFWNEADEKDTVPAA